MSKKYKKNIFLNLQNGTFIIFLAEGKITVFFGVNTLKDVSVCEVILAILTTFGAQNIGNVDKIRDFFTNTF